MSATTVIRLWTILAGIGVICASLGFWCSAWGLRIAWRRWRFQGLQRVVALRDIFMLASFTLGCLTLVGVSGGLIWLSINYTPDLYPVLQALGVPVLLCYIGYTLSLALFSTAGPIWVVSRFWALTGHLLKGKIMTHGNQPPPTAYEWCEFDPKVPIKGRKNGRDVEAHVTYWGRASQKEVDHIITAVGVVDKEGNLFISQSAPSFPWILRVDVNWNNALYATQIYGTESNPLNAGENLNFTVTLPD